MSCNVLFCFVSTGPNQYTVDPMLGKTVRGGKKTAPCHSIIGRSNVGAFHEDLAKVFLFLLYFDSTKIVFKLSRKRYNHRTRPANDTKRKN